MTALQTESTPQKGSANNGLQSPRSADRGGELRKRKREGITVSDHDEVLDASSDHKRSEFHPRSPYKKALPPIATNAPATGAMPSPPPHENDRNGVNFDKPALNIDTTKSKKQSAHVITPTSRQSPNLENLQQLDHPHPTDLIKEELARNADGDLVEPNNQPISADYLARRRVSIAEFGQPSLTKSDANGVSKDIEDATRAYDLKSKTACAQKAENDQEPPLAYDTYRRATEAPRRFTAFNRSNRVSFMPIQEGSGEESAGRDKNVDRLSVQTKHEFARPSTQANSLLLQPSNQQRTQAEFASPSTATHVEEEEVEIPCTPQNQMANGFATSSNDETFFFRQHELNTKNPFVTPASTIARHPVTLRQTGQVNKRSVKEEIGSDDEGHLVGAVARRRSLTLPVGENDISVQVRNPEDIPNRMAPAHMPSWHNDNQLREAYEDPQELFQLVEMLYTETCNLRVVDPHFEKHHPDGLTAASRLVVVDWIFWVFAELNGARSLAYISIDLFDRFMAATSSVEIGECLCYAAACCLLAWKSHDSKNTPNVSEFIIRGDNLYTPEKVFAAERKILELLSWALNIPDYVSTMHFILQNGAALCDKLASKVVQNNKGEAPKIALCSQFLLGSATILTKPYIFNDELMRRCVIWLDIAQYDHRFLQFPPPMVCAAVFYKVCDVDGDILFRASGYKLHQIVPLIDLFNDHAGIRLQFLDENDGFQKLKYQDVFINTFSQSFMGEQPIRHSDAEEEEEDEEKFVNILESDEEQELDQHDDEPQQPISNTSEWRERERKSRSTSEEDDRHYIAVDSGSEDGDESEHQMNAQNNRAQNLSSPTLVSA